MTLAPPRASLDPQSLHRGQIITRLWGGLGNQLFQYAAGFAVAHARRAQLILDPSQCHADKNRPYQLDRFAISARPWSPAQQRSIEQKIRLARPITHQTRPVARMLKRSARALLHNRFHYIEDRHQGFQPDIFHHRGDVYLAGTWASPEYFAHLRSQILHEFTFKDAPNSANARCLDEICAANALCVHVRRGDYIANPDTASRFGACSLDYYRQAFACISEKVPNPVLFLFSDDPDWCRANLRFPCETRFISHNLGANDHEDLRLMSACRHFIIANSTFSWWAAWLAQSPEKIVIAPNQWSIDRHTIGDPVPPHWIRL